ncbi:hypothetical protein ACSQ67_006900 [Phaseolus vulgaris]
MDGLFSSLKLLSLSFMFFFFLLKLTVLLWWRPRKIQGHFSKQGIRGPPYRFFIGNVKELVAMMLKASSKPMPFSHNILPRVLSFYHHWKKIYGATFLVWFGPTVRLTVSDPDLIREIFTSKSEFYEKNEAPPLVKQLEGDGLLSLKGEKWAHHRRIISPTFHMENLKLLIPVMATSVVEMLEKWSAMGEKGEVEIEVSEWFQSLTEDVITRTAFGSSYEDGKAIFRLQGQQMDLAADAFQKVFIPGYRFVPTRRNIKSWKLEKEIKKSLVKLIERRRENTERVEKGAKDLLGLMIEASNRNSTNVTVDDIVEECKSFFFAGKQTTSNLLTWTTILLAMHPHWQVRAREEVLKMCGSRDLPTKDHVAKLRTVSKLIMVIMWRPSQGNIFSSSEHDCERVAEAVPAHHRHNQTCQDGRGVGGYKIPRGTELLIPILAVHHDQAIWGNDANEFNPGRFSEGWPAPRTILWPSYRLGWVCAHASDKTWQCYKPNWPSQSYCSVLVSGWPLVISTHQRSSCYSTLSTALQSFSDTCPRWTILTALLRRLLLLLLLLLNLNPPPPSSSQLNCIGAFFSSGTPPSVSWPSVFCQLQFSFLFFHL